MSDFIPSQQDPEVYAVVGAEPEVQAYAMAKYSRSALSMKDSLHEISRQQAEKFLNTFYFQYGHRSIADLAHIAFAIERLSILAAIALVDEPRWDGQERSTRYQDFRKSGYYVPQLEGASARLYRETADFLFAEYEEVSQLIFEFLVSRTAQPAEMKRDAYERTLRARAFDITRYLLPLATNTSLGQIVNARTLEMQVSRLLSSEVAEIRRLGELLKEAARRPAWNARQYDLEKLLQDISDEGLRREARELVLRPSGVAPTLVKYADASTYEMNTRLELRQAAAELMDGAPLEPAPRVDLLEDEALEIELATTLLYEHTHYPYRQMRERVKALRAAQRDEIVALGTRHRGRHDELLRAFCAGQRFRFDILMDIGGFRDLHRHRRCVQVGQGFTPAHGYETPEEIEQAGVLRRYEAVMQRASAAVHNLATALNFSPEGARGPAHLPAGAQYLLPLAFRKRTLFKMDFAEAVYISELRTGAGGHISYRRVAYEMYEAVARRYPSLASMYRVTDVREPVDLLNR